MVDGVDEGEEGGVTVGGADGRHGGLGGPVCEFPGEAARGEDGGGPEVEVPGGVSIGMV